MSRTKLFDKVLLFSRVIILLNLIKATVIIAELRARCVRARRRYLRSCRWRRRGEEEVSLRHRAYRVLRRSLQRETKIAKDRAWSELLESVESDPNITRRALSQRRRWNRRCFCRLSERSSPRKITVRQNSRGKQPGRWNEQTTDKSRRKSCDQKNGLPRRGARSGSNPGPDLGGSDGGHGSQTSAPLHEMLEGGSLPPGMADGEAGHAP